MILTTQKYENENLNIVSVGIDIKEILKKNEMMSSYIYTYIHIKPLCFFPLQNVVHTLRLFCTVVYKIILET